ncbi:MAG: MoaD/ThiS family protein [Planctomycetota bacterium]|jgi:molybdopterin converting factor small subunit
MPSVTVELPSLLSSLIGESTIPVEAVTLAEALQAAVTRHPALGVHLFEESGNLREHVLCLVNEDSTRWLESLDKPLRDGDRVTVLQAVSGG